MTKIYFYPGALFRLGSEVAQLGKTALVVSGKNAMIKSGTAQETQDLLTKAGVGFDWFAGISPNPLFDEVVEGVTRARANGAQVVVGIGGGSAMDAAKAIAAFVPNGRPPEDLWPAAGEPLSPLPLVLIPTTSGTGSETSPFSVISMRSGAKRFLGGQELCAKVALVDPSICDSMPEDVTVDTAIDAFSHCFEAFLHPKVTPAMATLAWMQMRQIVEHLPAWVSDNRFHHREVIANAATIGGILLGMYPTALAHGLSYPLTAVFGLPHGRAVGISMPRVLEFDAPALTERLAPLAALWDLPATSSAKDTADAFDRWRVKVGHPERLRHAGVKMQAVAEIDIKKYIPAIKMEANLRPATLEQTRELLQSCW